jgi:ribonuclease BN (tRNA processing enzyme)
MAEKSFRELWEGYYAIGNDWLNDVQNIKLKLVGSNSETELGDIKIHTHKLYHRPESMGYEILRKGKKLAFSGDSGYSDNLVKLFAGADVAVIECSFNNQHSVEHHFSPGKLEKLFNNLIEINQMPRSWFLSHFYPGVTDSPDLKNLITKYGNITIAYDNLEVVI